MADGDLQGYESLRRRIAAISGPVLGRDIMKTLAMATVMEAKRLEAPHRKTGNLGRTIHEAEITDTTARVVASANYAAFLERARRRTRSRRTPRRRCAGPLVGRVAADGQPTRRRAAQGLGGDQVLGASVHHRRPVRQGRHHPARPVITSCAGAEKAIAGGRSRRAHRRPLE